MTKAKTYLGDGVYVDNAPSGGIVLTTWNGLGDTNRIVLEPEVLQLLADWVRRELGATAIGDVEARAE